MPLASLTLVDIDSAIVDAWRTEFARYPAVRISCGSILGVDADTLVSPANSFGIMDGGLDGLLRDYFGVTVEARVRQFIAERFHGELPVGLACIVETGHPKYRSLIAAPTMRCPSQVPRTVNAYLAMKALLNEAASHPQPLHVAVPGLCSLTGRMGPGMAARQMRIAYERVVHGLYGYSHWREEREFERYIRGETLVPPEDLEALFSRR